MYVNVFCQCTLRCSPSLGCSSWPQFTPSLGGPCRAERVSSKDSLLHWSGSMGGIAWWCRNPEHEGARPKMPEHGKLSKNSLMCSDIMRSVEHHNQIEVLKTRLSAGQCWEETSAAYSANGRIGFNPKNDMNTGMMENTN